MNLTSGALLSDFSSITPEAFLAAAGIVILLLDALLPKLQRLWTPLAAIFVAIAGWLVFQGGTATATSFGGFLDHSAATMFLSEVVLLSALLALLA